jgi:hypothetical protein
MLRPRDDQQNAVAIRPRNGPGADLRHLVAAVLDARKRADGFLQARGPDRHVGEADVVLGPAAPHRARDFGDHRIHYVRNRNAILAQPGQNGMPRLVPLGEERVAHQPETCLERRITCDAPGQDNRNRAGRKPRDLVIDRVERGAGCSCGLTVHDWFPRFAHVARRYAVKRAFVCSAFASYSANCLCLSN